MKSHKSKPLGNSRKNWKGYRAREWSGHDLSQLHIVASVNIHLHFFCPMKKTIRGHSMADRVLKSPSFLPLHSSHQSTSMFKAVL